MAAKWTIDNLNRLLILKAGITDIDVEVDLYSDWKEEYLLSDNTKFPPAMRAIGGDPITATQNAGATFFMINGWRIRPQEASHTLNITGNLFTDPAGDSVTVNTLGAFTVRVEMFVSNLVDSSVARLDLTQLLPAVFIDTVNGVPGTAIGIGTPTNPVDNITDARTIANRDNLMEYRFRGPLTLNADHVGWGFKGLSSEQTDILTLAGYNVAKSKFEGCDVQGSYSGLQTEFVNCQLTVISGLDGVCRECGLSGALTGQAGGTLWFDRCYSAVAGLNTPSFSCVANATLGFRSYSGGLLLKSHAATNTTTIEIDPGALTIDNTNTGGTIVVRGVGTLTDNSAGATINTVGFNPWSTILERLERIVRNRRILDQADGKLKVLDDASASVLLEALAWEDAAGTQAYRGQGVERTDRLETP